jgi:hypothetical protein
MSANTEQLKETIPPGLHPLSAAGRLRIPPIPVHGDQATDQPPMFGRARFGWSVGEVSGSLGDLGSHIAYGRR